MHGAISTKHYSLGSTETHPLASNSSKDSIHIQFNSISYLSHFNVTFNYAAMTAGILRSWANFCLFLRVSLISANFLLSNQLLSFNSATGFGPN